MRHWTKLTPPDGADETLVEYSGNWLSQVPGEVARSMTSQQADLIGFDTLIQSQDPEYKLTVPRWVRRRFRRLFLPTLKRRPRKTKAIRDRIAELEAPE